MKTLFQPISQMLTLHTPWQHKSPNIMQLQIFHSQVLKLSITKTAKQVKVSDKKLFSINFETQYDVNKDDVFAIIFDVEIKRLGDFKLKCKYGVWFKTSMPIDVNFKSSDFPRINAPAIAFPFLRSLIATITLNSGFSPFIMPSINFVEFGDKKHEK